MDVEHHLVPSPSEVVQRESQAIPAHSLGEVLGQLATVGLGFPPAARVPLLISNAVIRRGAGVGVEELAPAGQLHGQKREGEPEGQLLAERHPYSGYGSPAGADGVHGGFLHRIPELADAGVLPAPAPDDVHQAVVVQAQLIAAHPFHGPDTALVAQGQRCHLAALAVLVVGVALDDAVEGHTEDAGCGGLVDLAGGAENVQHPLLTSQPCDQPGLDGREVGIYEGAPFAGHQRCADQLAQSVGHIVGQQS